MSKELYLPEVPKWWADIAAIEGKESNSTGTYHIGHVLWQQYRLRKKATTLSLPVASLKRQGFGRHYVSTALRVLEYAGLIQVRRFGHKSPEIILVTNKLAASKLRGEVSNGNYKTDAGLAMGESVAGV